MHSRFSREKILQHIFLHALEFLQFLKKKYFHFFICYMM